MAFTPLEHLPNEIFKEIFSMFTPLDLLGSWWNLNQRFNGLIQSMEHQISLRNQPNRDQWKAISFFRAQVTAVTLSQRTCTLFNQFVNLRSLHILGSANHFSILLVKPQLLPHLIDVDFKLGCLEWDRFMGADDSYYARQMERCCFRVLDRRLPSVAAPSLRSASFLFCKNEAIVSIMTMAPNLVELKIGLDSPFILGPRENQSSSSNSNAETSAPTSPGLDLTGLSPISIGRITIDNEHLPFTPNPTHHFTGIQHHHIRRLRIKFDEDTTLKWLDAFLLCVPNVTNFTLKIPCSNDIFSFVDFHRILCERLPNLSEDCFHFEYFCLPRAFSLEQHRSIGLWFRNMRTDIIRSGPMRLLRISINWPKRRFR